MKKVLLMMACAVLTCSCGTYTEQGAVVGATFGTILGSAVGGIAGGWRGSDIGTVVGMAGGAVVGAAIGQAAENRAHQRASRPTPDREERGYGDSGYDPQGTGDDRVDFGISGPEPGARSQEPGARGQESGGFRLERDGRGQQTGGFHVQPMVEIRNVRVLEGREDGKLHAGGSCKVVFEVMNRTNRTLYNVCPHVREVTGNKYITVSPDMNVESVAPGTGIRYTATVVATRKLKDGTAVIAIGVTVENREVASQNREVVLETAKK